MRIMLISMCTRKLPRIRFTREDWNRDETESKEELVTHGFVKSVDEWLEMSTLAHTQTLTFSWIINKPEHRAHWTKATILSERLWFSNTSRFFGKFFLQIPISFISSIAATMKMPSPLQNRVHLCVYGGGVWVQHTKSHQRLTATIWDFEAWKVSRILF